MGAGLRRAGPSAGSSLSAGREGTAQSDNSRCVCDSYGPAECPACRAEWEERSWKKK